jgi:transglutaminase-like putative cysteine protease
MPEENKPEKPDRTRETPSGLPRAYGYRAWAINWRGIINVVLLFLTLEIAVLSVEQAHWITPQPSLTLTLVIAVLFVWYLARRRLPGAVLHIVAVLVGVLLTLWQAHNLLEAPDIAARFSRLMTALQSWWQAAETVPAGAENLSFAVFLIILTWLIGYISTWFLVRRRNAWVGVSLGALVVLVNLSNLTDGYYFYFGLYVLAAVLLVAHVRMVKHPAPAAYSRRGWAYIGAVLLCVVIVASTIGWFIPEPRLPKLQTFIATRMLWKKDVEESPLNIFSTISSKQPLSTGGTHQEQSFEEEWHQGDKVDFIVTSERPSYWRVHVYDIYTSRGWENSPVSDHFLDEKVTWGGEGVPAVPGVTTYVVSPNLKTDIMLLAGSFVSADNPSLVEVSAGEVIAVRTPRIFRPGEEYSVTSRIFSPSPGALSRYSGTYPPSIAGNYLQLPPDFPDDIRQLSENVTRNAATPYEKVLAIIDYLAEIPYSEKVKAPSGDVDMVEYFLFEQKSGFCLYYASAMAVMLRSVEVPSRLVVGYLPGDPGDNAGEYILRDRHYHAWPQVYFSGYGWVDLEPTPGGEGSGVAIETPWVSEEAIAQLSQWDVWLTYPPPELPDLFEGTAGGASTEKTSSGGAFFFADELGLALLVIMAALLILAILVTPVLVLRSSFYRWLWYVNRTQLASLAYDKMCSLAAMTRLGPRPQQTPLEFAGELAAIFPEQTGAFTHIARSYMESRFGRKGSPSLFEEAELLKARCNAFGVLLQRLGLVGKVTHGRI